jgi:hypothetical protein
VSEGECRVQGFRFKVESSPKSKNYATKALKHKIAPKLLVDFQTFVGFRDFVFWWRSSSCHFSEWTQGSRFQVERHWSLQQ